MSRAALRVLVGVLAFAALSLLCVNRLPPALPRPLVLDLTLAPASVGKNEPILTLGRTGAADFVFVRHSPAGTVQFGYDSWGHTGLLSPPLAFPLGNPQRLELELTGPDDPPGPLGPNTGRIRLTVAGRVALDAEVHRHPVRSDSVWLAANPIGGTSADALLHGELRWQDRALSGPTPALFARSSRVADWLARRPWQAFAVLLLSVGTASLVGRPLALRTRLGAALAVLSRHRWFAATATLGTLAFATVMTGGRFNFDYEDAFNTFYDYQAVSLLAGRLDVPDAAIGAEAFVSAGKLYGYFGPTPALFRLPLVMLDVGFVRWGRVFLLLEFAAALVAAYLILLHVVRLARGPGALPAPASVVLLLASTALGSTLFFLASRVYVYHEAILCGAMFALWSAWCSLRHLAAPDGRWWLGALVCGVLSLHARAPTGLFALTLLGCVAAAHLLRRPWSLRLHPLLLGLSCVLGVFTFNGLSYLKFRTFDGAPLHLNRLYDARRLAKFDGRNFHAANIPFNFHAYFLRPHFKLDPHFPYFFALEKPGPVRWGARMDMREPLVPVPLAMPSLFALATLGGAAAWLTLRPLRSAAFLLACSVVPLLLAMLAAIAHSHRYTGDFCPGLIAAAALGLAALEAAPARTRTFFQLVLAGLTLLGVAITLALTLHYQGEGVWGVPDEIRADYRSLRQTIDAFFNVPPPSP